MSEARQSNSKVPQILDKQAPGHGETQSARREHHKREREAAAEDVQGALTESADGSAPAAELDAFDSVELKTLLADSTRICVSIHIGAHPDGNVAAVMTEFKNLYRQALHQLTELGMDPPEAADLLVPVQELLEHRMFWQNTAESVAVFRSPELFRVYRVAMPLKDHCLVNDHFYFQPLLPLLNSNGRFYVLTLSQDDIRLLRGTREQLKEVKLEGVPRNMAEALNEEPERHAFNRGPAFGAGQQFHGHSQAPEDTGDRLNQFFHMVDKGLHKYLKDETAPLVLAGVEYLFPIYKAANTYPHLVEQGITGSPRGHTARELHDLAWPLVQPLFLRAQQSALNRFNEARALPGLISDSLEEIAPAAAFVRVDTLFQAADAEVHGTVNSETGEVQIHEQPETGDEELMNYAAMQTLLHSGTVYPMPREEMPDNAQIAALFRY